MLAVNTRLVPEADIPTTWEQLADPKWKGKIAYAGADRSGSALIQLLQILHNFGEERGWQLFERMVEAADKTGTAATPETVRALGEESLFGDAITLGAKIFNCSGVIAAN